MEPIISVIVPVYKVEKYIRECIDSILAQTFHEIEIILVDDGSPDKSGRICDEFAQMDERVQVIHQNNRGLSCARNAGIEKAKGKYLCFVDSDDSVAPNYCEKLYHILDGTVYDFAVCAVLRYEDGTAIAVNSERETIVVYENSEFLGAQLNRQQEFGVWNKLYRRELFDKLRFMAGKIHEDVIFSADLAMNCKNGVIATSNQLYYYRQRNSGIVAAGSQKCSSDRIFAGEYLIEATDRVCPEWKDMALNYSVSYPWMFVDRIYIRQTFKVNNAFLKQLQRVLKKYRDYYEQLELIDEIIRKRMMLFATSRFLYGFNVYARMIRLYLYRAIKKDAYADGHGI